MAAGSFEREIAQLSEKYARNSASRIFAPLADAYRRAGRLDEAVAIGQEGLRHHPDYLGGRIVLARSFFDRGDLELAAAEFRHVLEFDPQNLVALRALGEIAEQEGDSLGAESSYRRALEVDSGNEEIRQRLEQLSASPAADLAEAPAAAPWDSALTSVRRGEAAVPSAGLQTDGAPEEIATVTLAEIYADQGLHERALGIYRRILLEDPSNERIRERAERLERRVAEERARLDAESGTSLGGFVPGELQPTGDEVLTSERIGGFDDAEAAAPSDEPDAFSQVGARRPPAEPWSFLLEDESDVDADELFSRGGRRDAAPRDSRETPSSAPEKPTEDEDLRKFQEWLRSLQ